MIPLLKLPACHAQVNWPPEERKRNLSGNIAENSEFAAFPFTPHAVMAVSAQK
jgi:hypothetical protein